MIIVNLAKSWPAISTASEPERSRLLMQETLGEWFGITEASIKQYGDVILGTFRNEVVSACEIHGSTRIVESGRVTFAGGESPEYTYMIGRPNPGRRWERGMGRPIQYLDTRVFLGGTVEVEEPAEGIHRAVVEGFTITVGNDGNAHVLVPGDRTLTVEMLSER